MSLGIMSSLATAVMGGTTDNWKPEGTQMMSLLESATCKSNVNNESISSISATTDISQINSTFPEKGIISDTLLTYIDFGICLPLCTLVSLLGVVTNFINIVVFIRQGLQGTITLAFFALAWSDLGICISSLEIIVAHFVHHYHYDIKDSISVHYKTGAYLRALFYAISSYLTLFAATEQCLNVAVPFLMQRFKSRGRITFIIIVIYAICICFFVPHFIKEGVIWSTKGVPENELNMVAKWFKDNAMCLEELASTFSGIFTPTVNQILIIITSSKMTAVLRSSREFRARTTVPVVSVISGVNRNKIYSQAARERTIRRMVNVVCILFIVCNFPVMVIVYCRTLIPGLSFSGRYRNLHSALHWIVIFCGSLNAGVNMFVYLKLSSKFRRAFRSVFARTTDTTTSFDS